MAASSRTAQAPAFGRRLPPSRSSPMTARVPGSVDSAGARSPDRTRPTASCTWLATDTLATVVGHANLGALMHAEEISAGELFRAGNQLLIPLWQRHYSWEGTQWSELWTDLERTADTAKATHFLGSVVLKALPWSGLPSEAHRYWVVDGQQRIATLTILVCAIRDRIALLKDDDERRAEIRNEYSSQLLVNSNLKSSFHARLVLQEKDQSFLIPIVSGEWNGHADSPIERCYDFFKSKLASMDAPGLEKMLSLILTRLTAVWVTLEEGDNAHRVFQTLNAGGKKLRQADLVRNYFFLLLGESSDHFYTSHWRRMESDLSDRELEDYLVAWSISQGHSGSRESLFSYFHKDLLSHESHPDQVADYGKRLTATSKLFRWIRRPSDSLLPAPVKLTMVDLANWSTIPAEGLILWALRQHADGALNPEELRTALEMVLSFVARRQLAGYEPNLHKSIFVAATRQLRSIDHAAGQDVVDHLHFLLSSGNDLRAWPTDEAIRAVARSAQLYSSARSGWCLSLLERINRGMFESHKHAPDPVDRSKFSVEHIMPQTLTDEWVDDLERWGVDSPLQLHQTHLHTLGNLTISPINSELGNAPFAAKKAKLDDDWLRINQEIVSAATWTEHRINERSTMLAAIACKAYTPPLGGDAQAAFAYRFRPDAAPSDFDLLDNEPEDD